MKNSALKSLAAYLMVSFLSFAVMAADINNTNNMNTIDSQRPDNISDKSWSNLKSAVQETKLVPTPSGIGGRNTKFASSISVDGNRVLIGATRYDFQVDSNPQGAVTVMEYDGVTKTWNETATLMALDGIPENNFGISVSLSGNRALIGAYRDDDSGFTKSGAAYVFDFDVNTNSWSQSQKLTASDLASNDFFGISVSLSGDRALIGSYGDVAGSAYIFDFDSNSNNWLESQKLTASDGASNDNFGYSVSLSGNRALVGSYGDVAGSAYIFDLDSNSNDWSETQKITASDGASNDYFGRSVSLSGDRVLIGANGDDDLATNSGAAYVFDYILDSNTNTYIWTEKQKLISDSANPYKQSFGSAVSLSGDRALIGAKKHKHIGTVNFQSEGSAYLFELNGNTNDWIQEQELIANDAFARDEFGTSVSLSDNWAMIGAPLKSDTGHYSGSAYVFESIDSPFGIIWQQTQKLLPTEGATYESFGYSVSLSGDRALIGAYRDGFLLDGSTFSSRYSGSAYIFDFDNNTKSWTLSQKFTPDDVEAEAEFGRSVSLSGDRALIGAHKDGENSYQAGVAYIFDFDVNNNTWSQTQKLYPDVGEGIHFGISVSLSGDRALVGVLHGTGIPTATRPGSVYVFDLDTNTNLWSKSQILFADDGTSVSQFGRSVSLLGDRAVIIGAGSVYVFDLDTITWLQTIKLSADDGVNFGSSISQSQDWILVGAYFDDVIGTNSGSAYVFKYSPSAPNWVQAQKLTPIDGAAYDYFGYSVSLSGNRALIGARATNLNNNTSPGSAYIFDLDINTDNWSQSQKLTALDGVENDRFGVSVSLSGDKALIGANFNDGNGIESGAAYVLNLDTYDVSVNVTGLAQGNSIELLNNGGDNIVVNTDSIATFPTSIINGRDYNVTVMLPQPTSPNQNCVVTDPMGTINSAHIELAVICTTIKYDIAVTVTGLDANNLIELTSNSQTLDFTGEGMQSFAGIDDGSDYAVLLTAQPDSPNQTCTITGGNSGDNDGSGALAGSNVTDISVSCADNSISLSSITLNYGAVSTGSQVTNVITVTNTGSSDVIISGLTNPTAPFSIVGGSCTAFPTTLAANASCEILILFSPTDEGTFNGNFFINSNAISSPDGIALLGTSSIHIIPTLDQWGLMLLILMILGMAYRKRNSSNINKHFSVLIVMVLFSHQIFSFEQDVENVLQSYPDSIMQFAGCLMSVEKMKSDIRRKDFPDSKPMFLDEGTAIFFAEKAMQLELSAKELGIFANKELLNAHMNSIRERTLRPKLLAQIEKDLIDYDITLEKCIALPDLVKKKQLAIKLANDQNKSIGLPEINGVFDHCNPIANAINIPVRKEAAIVSTGTELLVWGGKVGNVMSQTGMRYDLLTDSWSLMKQNGAIPTARWAAEAVWTGTEMIVYGGTNRSNNLGTDIYNGSRFNPVTNTWTAMSNVSEIRTISGKAVMVGSTMVIWGNPNTASGGARYYPNSDFWDTMRDTNVPPIRFGNTVTSTGAQMLIFGGQSGSTFLNDFWAYTPNQNSWTQLPTPSTVISPPRYDHSAVFTGTEMLVFGGTAEGFTKVDKGARYNFGNNTWSSMSTSGDPVKRSQHGAAWTGSEMIIWAGVDSFVYRGGATYNPINDSWTALPFGNTTPRRDFFSAWTGSEFIAFSNDISNNLIAGDIYTKNTNTWRTMPTIFAIENPNVEAYWVMDELDATSISSPNNKRVLDICGDRDSRIVTNNSPQLTNSGAQVNTTAISFDSGSDKLEYLAGYGFTDGGPNAGGEIDFGMNESMTLEALVRIPENFTDLGSIVEKDTVGSGAFWYLFINNGSLFSRVSDGVSTSFINSNTSINDNQWHQVALVRDDENKTLSIYIDYKLDTQISNIATEGSVTASATPISIAGIANLGNGELSGDVDYIRLSKGVVPVSQMAYADRVVDMTVALSNVGFVEPDATIVYTLTVMNQGPSMSTNVSVVNDFSNDFVTVTWTCVASVNSSCTNSGNGDINDSVDIPVNGSVVYTIDATLSSLSNSEVSNTATVATTEVDDVELNLSNNSASLTTKLVSIFSNGFE